MKQILIFIIGFNIRANSQCITFSYDAAGDRTSRNICPQGLHVSQKNLTDADNKTYFQQEKVTSEVVILFPNPIDGVLQIKTAYFTAESRLLITDILGRKHYAGKLGDGRIDLSSLYPGQYFVRISEGGIIKVATVLKN